VHVTGIDSLLVNYQRTVEKLLSLRNYTGFSLQELELFKKDFKASAFTCRLWSCPSAVSGFDSNELRLRHEATHWGVPCQVLGCPYPPFFSKRALDRHRVTCHEVTSRAIRKSIRKPSVSSERQLEGSFEFACQISGCSYPPFYSKVELDIHRKSYHDITFSNVRKSIGKTSGSKPLEWDYSGLDWVKLPI
jgi:hypothetical protein